MEDLTKKYPFQIPSYFALILRAFSVIEGIALRSDPKYAIVQASLNIDLKSATCFCHPIEMQCLHLCKVMVTDIFNQA